MSAIGKGPPGYSGRKQRCDHCGIFFREEDVIAVMPMKFVNADRAYELIFCFIEGDLRCMRFWRFQYGVHKESTFTVMIFKGRNKGRGHSEGSLVEA